jgi:tellurite resistance protein
MNREIFADRERGLEYEFFHRVDQKLWQQLRDNLACEKEELALSEATGISDEAVLHELTAAGFTCETMLALSLVPLVQVAWADGSIDDRERAAILDAAQSVGHSRDSLSFQLLEKWLDRPPEEKVMVAWKDFVRALSNIISPEARQKLKTDLLRRARQVAKASGGFLGIHKISAAERRVLNELEGVFDDH